MSRISVIVPAYNCETTLCRCIDSVLNQTLEDFELIIINDGSTDNTLLIAEEYAQNDQRITVYSQLNQGQGAARNWGIRLSNSSNVVFVDSDDCINPSFLEKMLDALVFTDSDIANCEIDNLLYEGNGDIKHLPSYLIPKLYDNLAGEMAASLCMDGVAPVFNSPCAKIIKKSLFTDNNIWFPEGHRYIEDLPTCIKLFLVSIKVTLVHEPLYRYIRTENSTMTSNASIKKAVDIVQNTEDIIQFINERGIKISLDNFVLGMIFPIEKNIVRAPREKSSAERNQVKQIKSTLKSWRKAYRPVLKIKDMPRVQKVKLMISYMGVAKAFAIVLSAFRWLPQIRYLT